MIASLRMLIVVFLSTQSRGTSWFLTFLDCWSSFPHKLDSQSCWTSMYKTNTKKQHYSSPTVYLIQRIQFNLSVSEYLRYTVSQMKDAFFHVARKRKYILPYSMACLVWEIIYSMHGVYHLNCSFFFILPGSSRGVLTVQTQYDRV